MFFSSSSSSSSSSSCSKLFFNSKREFLTFIAAWTYFLAHSLDGITYTGLSRMMMIIGLGNAVILVNIRIT